MVEPRRFEVVEDTPDPAVPEQAQRDLSLLLLSLKALSQRALVALSSLFTLLTVFSAFWLWWSIPHPDAYQLVGLGMYAVFVLAANFIVKRG
jgi:hypothetical protein